MSINPETMKSIIEAIMSGKTPEGFTKIELSDGSIAFGREVPKEKANSLDAWDGQKPDPFKAGQSLNEILREAFAQRDQRDEDASGFGEFERQAQEQHDKVMREQHYEKVLKHATFNLGNAMMLHTKKHVMKTLRLLLDDAGECAVNDDEHRFDMAVDAFNGLLIQTGIQPSNAND